MRDRKGEPWPTWFLAAFFGMLALGLLSCAMAGTPDPIPPRQMQEDTRVCVENDREFYVRVEVRDSRNGAEFGEIAVPSYTIRCEDLPAAQAGKVVTAVIKAVGLARDIAPPAWRRMMVGRSAMRLTVGQDGASRFAHSARTQ